MEPVQFVASTHLSPCPSVHPPMLVWEWRGESVDTVNPVAEPSHDGGQRKMGGWWKDRPMEGGEVCLCSTLSLRGGLAYLDWFQPQQQPDGAPALHPLSSPQHPDLITQPCDSGLEPRGRETDRREGREKGERQTERGLISWAATLLTFINFIFTLIEPNLVVGDLYQTTYLHNLSSVLKGSAY